MPDHAVTGALEPNDGEWLISLPNFGVVRMISLLRDAALLGSPLMTL
jgi:hypothetical protein